MGNTFSWIYTIWKIFAVIIAYNNEKTIKRLYNSINKDLFHKIILIDDCSTDNTFSIAKTLGCECYQNKKNLGMGGNLKKSMQIFYMGADYVLEFMVIVNMIQMKL